jgi:hypothetical protein
MEYLKGMTRLQQFLVLNGTKITDAGLEHVKGMTRLQMLAVVGTQVTDVGMQKLKESLPTLKIGRIGVTPTHLIPLKNHPLFRDFPYLL